MPLVYITVLNWNGTADTLECLEALKALTYPEYRILIIDNGSAEPCTAAVAERFPDVEVIELPTNLGFAGGNNFGMRLALERGAEYVWLLNNDTVVEPDALTALAHAAETGERVGLVGSKILFFRQDGLIDHAGGFIAPWRFGGAGHIGLGERDQGQYDETRPVDYVSGCSLLARREMIEETGFLDEQYFAYWEDVDWCTRAQQGGWNAVYAPGSVVHHKGGRETEISPLRFYLAARNTLRYMAKYRARFLPVVLPWWTAAYLAGPVKRMHPGHLAMGLRALRDWALARDSSHILESDARK
jgi:GT2 family glycosyltransferase